MFRNIVTRTNAHVDVGLLVIRLGIGLTMLGFHGYGKLTGGPDTWRMVGTGMESLGIGFAPVLWGFLAACAEFFASILLMLGALFRPAALILAFTMFVAVLHHVTLPTTEPASGWLAASNALKLLIIYVGLFVTGPGRFAFSLLREKEVEARK